MIKISEKRSRVARQYKNICDLIDMDKSLTTIQAGIYLGLSPRTLEHYRCKGGGPSYQKFKRLVRYPASELIAWRSMRLVDSTSEY